MSLRTAQETTDRVRSALEQLLPLIDEGEETPVRRFVQEQREAGVLTPWTRQLFASLVVRPEGSRNILHIAAEKAASTGSFAVVHALVDAFVSSLDASVDKPLELNSFATIPEALEEIRLGKYVVVVDDESRENEGDLIMASELVTEEAIAFMVRYTSGLICVSVTSERLAELNLPLMVQENTDTFKTAFTVSIDYKHGTTTGISASDRAKTLRAICASSSQPEDFNRPGHIFPLRYREGGVIVRPGHTEASLDLARMAGLFPSGVLCEITNDDGTMSRRPQLSVFCKQHNLLMITIKDLIDYRMQHQDA